MTIFSEVRKFKQVIRALKAAPGNWVNHVPDRRSPESIANTCLQSVPVKIQTSTTLKFLKLRIIDYCTKNPTLPLGGITSALIKAIEADLRTQSPSSITDFLIERNVVINIVCAAISTICSIIVMVCTIYLVFYR